MPSVTITYTPAMPPSAAAGNATVRGNRLTLPVSCTGGPGATCSLTATLSVTEIVKRGRVTAIAAGAKKRIIVVGTTTATVDAGQKTTLGVTLNGTGGQLLARFRVLKVKLIVTLSDSSGKAITVASKLVTFKAKPGIKKTH